MLGTTNHDAQSQGDTLGSLPERETDPKKIMQTYSVSVCGPIRNFLRAHWKWLLICAAPLLLYGAMYLYFVAEQKYKDYRFPLEKAAAEAKLGGVRITLADAVGTHVPPVPDSVINSSTVAGVDANLNYIRDDVEHALFALYPKTSATDELGNTEDTNLKKRAAALQYAQALQLFLTRVYDEHSIRIFFQYESDAWDCIGEEWEQESEMIESLVLDTEMRKLKKTEIYNKFMTSFGVEDSKNACHVIL